MAVFTRQQEQMREAMQTDDGVLLPVQQRGVEEVGRQNMAMVERAMSLFNPFYRASSENAASAAELEAEVERLRRENEELRQQLANAAPVKTPRKAPASSD